MHTRSPGSPFSIILNENPSKEDIEETTIFTGCFSSAWKKGKKGTVIDIFLLEQMYKNKNMKIGTFGVAGKIAHKKVRLKLYFTKQNNVLRAVPFKTGGSLCIIPGKTAKKDIAEQIAIKLNLPFEEAIQAIPTGQSDFASTPKTKKIKKKKNTWVSKLIKNL